MCCAHNVCVILALLDTQSPHHTLSTSICVGSGSNDSICYGENVITVMYVHVCPLFEAIQIESTCMQD
jgi:pyruvoyl-dependent arginine decarboxylase (PvlArgDC)